MYSINIVRSIINRRVFTASIRKFSTVPAEKIAEQKNTFDKHIRDLESLTTILSKNRTKLPQREPFVKNLFLGKVDEEILAYPELSKKDVDDLEASTNILQKISVQEGEPIDTKEALNRLKMQKCLGLSCPINIGCRELNESEQCRYNEILLDNNYKYAILYNELCINILSGFGTVEQKAKYLQKLLNGEISSTISIANNSEESDENHPERLRAYLTQDLESYRLKGKKKYILNADDADLFIFFIPTGDTSSNFFQNNEFKAFLIDKSTKGVKIEKLDVEELGLKACNIVLDDILVKKENILGFNQIGENVLMKILPNYYLNSSVMNLNNMKKLINSLSNDLLDKTAPGDETYKTEAITSKMSEILSNTYMVESMIYFTSGIMSTYDNQDCHMESLITKVFSTKLCLQSSVLGFDLVGISSIISEHFCQQLHKEALAQYTCCENQNMSELTIGLLGIQHAGKSLGDTVKKLRNPMFNGTFILKRLWQNRKQDDDNPSLTLELKNYFHPSCQEAADDIEYCVLRLQYATEILLSKYGIDVLNCHNHLRRLSESVMYIYGMISCLSRASRSYCTGLENNESEMIIANVICRNGFKRVRSNLNDIIQECLIMDDPMKTLSETLYSKKKYYFVNPLSRNF